MDHLPSPDNETTAMWDVLLNYEEALAQSGNSNHPVLQNVQELQWLLLSLEAKFEAPFLIKRQ